MKIKLNKYETLYLEWLVFLKKSKKEIITFVNKCKSKRLITI